MNKILVEVSVGELLDKISILEIKKEKIKDSGKLNFINDEYIIVTTDDSFIVNYTNINLYNTIVKYLNVNKKIYFDHILTMSKQ